MSAAPPSPTPRRIATPSWLDLRLVLGVLLVLASVLAGAVIVSRASRTYPVVALSRSLAAGTVLSHADVHLVQAQLPDRGAGVYLTAVDRAVGKRLQRPVSGGELLPAAAVAPVHPQTTITVPLADGAAPSLRSGQRIEVWLSTPACPSVVLLPDVTVQSVHADDGGSFGGGTGGQDVVLAVEPAIAGRVVEALALDSAKLRAGVLVGRPASDGSVTTPVPDLDSCGASESPTK